MKKELHMIGNTHFDPVWLWTWDEAMSSIRATFHSALERMKEYPDFKYSFSAPAVFEWIEKTEPEMFEEIRQRVKEGRWELAEGWWLQPDCVCAGGESYIRQGLYAQKYFQEHFGKLSRTVFNVDSFGHPASFPQILNQCGITNYMFCRPCYGHKQLEDPLFVWKGDNNSQVYTYRVGNLAGACFPPEVKDSLSGETADFGDKAYPLCILYGVTDHGGAPTKEAITHIHQFDETSKEYRSRMLEQGSIRTTVKLIWHYHMSVIEQYYTLYRDFVECRYRVGWNEQKKTLKFSLISDLAHPECEVAIPYGRIKRKPCIYERPMGEWLTLTEGTKKVNIMADSIFAYHFDGKEIGLTVLRSCIYGDLRTKELDPEGDFCYMGQGVTEGRIRISFGDLPEKEAICLNNPPVVTVESNHGGSLKGEGQFFHTDNDNVILSACKLSEDGRAIVARLHEIKGRGCTAEGRIFETAFQEHCSSNEIMTLRIEAENAEKVSALEDRF